MDPWHWWLIAAITLIALEIFTSDFLFAAIGIACLGAAVAAGFETGLPIQLGAFAGTAILALSFVRPTVLRHLHKSGEDFPSNIDGVAGQTGTITTAAGDTEQPGRVKIGGEEWRAVSHEGHLLGEGTIVEVVSVDSATLLVRPRNH